MPRSQPNRKAIGYSPVRLPPFLAQSTLPFQRLPFPRLPHEFHVSNGPPDSQSVPFGLVARNPLLFSLWPTRPAQSTFGLLWLRLKLSGATGSRLPYSKAASTANTGTPTVVTVPDLRR